jgi:hypothetical protein
MTMAVKPWAQITTYEEGIEYVSAELAEALQFCPSSVPAYQVALATIQAAPFSTDETSAIWSKVEADLAAARAVWTSSGCSMTYTEPATGTTVQVAAPGDATKVVLPGAIGGGSNLLLLGVAAGAMVYFLSKKGKKGKGKRRVARRKPRRRTTRRPARRRRR